MSLSAKESQPDDLQIQPETPIFYIVDIVLYPVVDRGISSPPVHLCPAGNTRFDKMGHVAIRNLSFELFNDPFLLKTALGKMGKLLRWFLPKSALSGNR